MTALREAATLALQALEGWNNYGKWVWPESALEQTKRNTTGALTALRAALAEPVQEPVAWRTKNATPPGGYVVFQQYPSAVADLGGEIEPLYTAPPQRKPLSGLEVERLLEQVIGSVPAARRLVRAIERAHGIGDNDD